MMKSLWEVWRDSWTVTLFVAGLAALFTLMLMASASQTPPSWQNRLDQIYGEQIKTNQLLLEISGKLERQK